MASAGARSRSSSANGRVRGTSGYVMCIDNDGYVVSLEVGKVYRVLRPHKSVPPNWIRVVDESGEDYLYPSRRFVPVHIPAKGKRALASQAQAS